MTKCKFCKSIKKESDKIDSSICCDKCGRITDEERFSRTIQFQSGTSGKSKMIGKIVGRPNFSSSSNQSDRDGRISRTSDIDIDCARVKISNLLDHIGVRPKQEIDEASIRLYSVTREINYCIGKIDHQILAVCCYIICRQKQKPFMLLEFSEQLQVNLFTIGSIYINLCKHLYIEKAFRFNIASDPCCYVHRFVEKLNIGNERDQIISTTICFINSMKRHWIQTGRNDAGIVGSAIYMSLKLHNMTHKRTKILEVIQLGNATINKRIEEFLETDTSFLTKTMFKVNEEIITRGYDKVTINLNRKNNKRFSVTHSSITSMTTTDEVCAHIRMNTAEPYLTDQCFGCFISNSCEATYSFGNPPSFEKDEKKNVIYMSELSSNNYLMKYNMHHRNIMGAIEGSSNLASRYSELSNEILVLNNNQEKWAGIFDINQAGRKTILQKKKHENHLDENLSDLELTYCKTLIHTDDEACLKYKIWKETYRTTGKN